MNRVDRIDIDDDDVDCDDWQRLLYRGEAFTGEVAEYAAGGVLISLEVYTDGLADGTSRSWYPDGAPQAEGRTSQGHPVGRWQEWFPDGRVQRVTVFSDNGDVVDFVADCRENDL